MAKNERRHSTVQAQEKRRKLGKMKKISYLIERKNTHEFTPPLETSWNRFLANHKPLEKVDSTGKLDMTGKLGKVSRFFVPNAEMKRIKLLFQEFHIPENLHEDLTWSYLNMAFAGADAPASDEFSSSLDHNLDKLYETLEFLKALSEDRIKISYVHIDVAKTGASENSRPGEKYTLKMQGPLDTGFIEDVLKLYPQIEAYKSLNAFHEIQKQHGKQDRFMGHKNSQKQAQAYYAWAIFDFLKKNVFNSLSALVNDMPKLKLETERLKKLHSDRQLYWFIGRLMQLSGLLPADEDYPKDSLIDLIKKKIGPRRTSRPLDRRKNVGKNAST